MTTWVRALLIVVIASAIGCSSVPVKPVTSVKDVAGKWTGSGRTDVGLSALDWTIHEDGRVDVIAAVTGAPPIRGIARVSVRDGRLFYESGTSSGPVTLYEGEGRRMLRYDGVTRGGARAGADLTPAK